MTWRNTWLCGPGAHQRVMDEIELGEQVAKVWAWGRTGVPGTGGVWPSEKLRALDRGPVHYMPPPGYAEVRAAEKRRARAKADAATEPPPLGQITLF